MNSVESSICHRIDQRKNKCRPNNNTSEFIPGSGHPFQKTADRAQITKTDTFVDNSLTVMFSHEK